MEAIERDDLATAIEDLYAVFEPYPLSERIECTHPDFESSSFGLYASGGGHVVDDDGALRSAPSLRE